MAEGVIPCIFSAPKISPTEKGILESSLNLCASVFLVIKYS